MATDRGLLVLIACCWVLIFTCCPPLTGAARFPAAYKRALQLTRGQQLQQGAVTGQSLSIYNPPN
jgi:hypothetical protein